MALQSTSNAKDMPELSMLTILIGAAASLRNQDGDISLHGYVENQGLTNRKAMELSEAEVDFAVLDSIGDTLLQDHQVLAITPSYNFEKHSRSITVMISDEKADSDQDSPAEYPINLASKVSLIRATVVPNPNDRHSNNKCESGGPLGSFKQVSNGKSLWNEVKEDPLFYAVE